MRPLYRALSLVALLALAGCATNDSGDYNQGPMLGAMTPDSGVDANAPVDPNAQQAAVAPPPSQAVAAGVSNLDIGSFMDAGAFKALSDASKSEASSAQYYALQFGRVGAARTWNGDAGTTGSVNVGPYVKVNNRDCRDFTNIVNVGPKSYTKRGTACRGDDGMWAVGTAAAGAPATAPAAAPAAASGIGASG